MRLNRLDENMTPQLNKIDRTRVVLPFRDHKRNAREGQQFFIRPLKWGQRVGVSPSIHSRRATWAGQEASEGVSSRVEHIGR